MGRVPKAKTPGMGTPAVSGPPAQLWPGGGEAAGAPRAASAPDVTSTKKPPPQYFEFLAQEAEQRGDDELAAAHLAEAQRLHEMVGEHTRCHDPQDRATCDNTKYYSCAMNNCPKPSTYDTAQTNIAHQLLLVFVVLVGATR